MNYKHKFDKEKYDRISVRIPKGEAEKIRTFASGGGESVNEFINRIISYHVPDFRRVGEQTDEEKE